VIDDTGSLKVLSVVEIYAKHAILILNRMNYLRYFKNDKLLDSLVPANTPNCTAYGLSR